MAAARQFGRDAKTRLRQTRLFRSLTAEGLEPRLLLAADDPFEANDSKADVDAAVPGGVNSPNLGLLISARTIDHLVLDDPEDWFRFQTASIGTIKDVVRISCDPTLGELDIYLYGSDGVTQLQKRSTDISSASIPAYMIPIAAVDLGGRAAGTYYVKVVGQAGVKNPNYTLTFEPPGDQDDLFEPNDSTTEVNAAASAGLASPNLGLVSAPLQIGELQLRDKNDLFRFDIVAGGTSSHFVRIDYAYNPDELNQTFLQLLNSSGTLIRTGTAGSDSFGTAFSQLSLSGLASGTYYAKVFMADKGVTEYTLQIQPPGTSPQAEVAVSIASVDIVDGAKQPIDFGPALFSRQAPARTFIVTNQGAAALHTLSPALPAGFTLTEPLNATIQPGGSDTFTVELETSQLGAHFGDVTIVCDDSNENVFNFAISGDVLPLPHGPVLNVLHGETELPGGSTLDFGTGEMGEAGPAVYLYVRNNGDEQLHLGAAQAPSGFAIIQSLGPVIEPGGINIVQLQLTTTAQGSFSGQFRFSTSDPDVPEFSLSLLGNVVVPPLPDIDDPYEANDDVATVAAATPGAYHSPNLGVLVDVREVRILKFRDAADWFRFEITSVGTRDNFVSIDFPNDQGDLDLALYKEDGTTIVKSSASATNDFEVLSLEKLVPGAYFLKVYADDAAVSPGYVMLIFPPGSEVDDAYEGNDSVVEVDAAAVGDPFSPNLGLVLDTVRIAGLQLRDDSDWFRFEIPEASGLWSVRIEGFDASQGDLDLWLYSPAIPGFAFRVSQPTPENFEQLTLGLPGVFYARVGADDGATNPNYTLIIQPPVGDAGDSTPPVVELLSPNDGRLTVGQNVEIEGIAGDSSGISYIRIELYKGGVGPGNLVGFLLNGLPGDGNRRSFSWTLPDTLGGLALDGNDYRIRWFAVDATANENVGSDFSNLFAIHPPNVAPVFVGGGHQQIDEDAGAQLVHEWATGMSPGRSSESWQQLEFELDFDHPELFETPPALDAATGNLSYTPAANAYGTSTVTVKLKDDGGTDVGGIDESAPVIFTISVNRIYDWRNARDPLDVNNSGAVTPVDALLIINELNDVGTHALVDPAPPTVPDLFYDCSADDGVTPLDALLVINYLNEKSSSSAQALVSQAASTAPAVTTYSQRAYAVAAGDRELLDLALTMNDRAIRDHDEAGLHSVPANSGAASALRPAAQDRIRAIDVVAAGPIITVRAAPYATAIHPVALDEVIDDLSRLRVLLCEIVPGM